MSKQAYTIKPLEWVRSFGSDSQCFLAETPFGSMSVRRDREDFDPDKPWMSWKWGYCFDEHYDEDCHECKNSIEGKRLANEHWQERMLEMLEPASLCKKDETDG